MIISDTQEPFSAERSIAFCKYVQKEFKIPNSNCFHVGDETDQFHGGLYDKDGEYEHTPRGEIQAAKQKMLEWYSAFPEMKVCISNHGNRWLRKAAAVQMPSELLRTYRELYDAPQGWQWKEEWKNTNTKFPWRMIHGMGYSGKDGARNAALDAGMSTVIGHLHSYAGIHYIKTLGRKDLIWGFNVGSLIDVEAYCFKYSKYSRSQPCLGVGVIFQDGKMPVWIPYE